MILDYHFRGEQDLFESEHPELKDKALKMMGPVLYYDLTAYNHPLVEATSHFKSLWKFHEQVEASVDKELQLNAGLVDKIMMREVDKA